MLTVDKPVQVEQLKAYPFFAKAPDSFLSKLLPNLCEREYRAGDTILRMGDYGDAAYFIAEGVVEVRLAVRPSADVISTPTVSKDSSGGIFGAVRRLFNRSSDQAPITQGKLASDGTLIISDLPVDVKPGERILLEQGEIFGEMSALSRYPISADIVAASDVRVLLIATAALRKMFKKAEFADFKRYIDDRYRQRTLATHLQRVELFAQLEPALIDGLRTRAELLSFNPGELIVEQGASADSFYLVRGGYVKVGVRSGSGALAVTYLRKGDFAGETALLLDEPWPFSLTALEHVELVRLSRQDFDDVVSKFPDVQRALWESTVARLKERGYASRNPLSAQYLQMAMDTGLIHGESVLLINLSTCTKCDDCVRACADVHDGTPRFIREGIRYRNWSVPTACYQCSDPVCMMGCPTGAISRPIGTREVTINPDTCIGCGICEQRCPWHNITSVPFYSAPLGKQIDLRTKCDLCIGRPEGPACVQMCPHGAAVRISFKDVERVTETLSR